MERMGSGVCAAVAVMIVCTVVPAARAADAAGAANASTSTATTVAAQIRVNGLDEYGGVRAWMSPIEVRAVLGEPAKTAMQQDGREVWRYPAVAVIFDGQGRGVSALMVMGANAPRIAGVGIGSSEAEILAALGEPVIPLHRTSVGGATLRYGSGGQPTGVHAGAGPSEDRRDLVVQECGGGDSGSGGGGEVAGDSV